MLLCGCCYYALLLCVYAYVRVCVCVRLLMCVWFVVCVGVVFECVVCCLLSLSLMVI